jgi:drug/metabolite transporter (DMT)-like permease
MVERSGPGAGALLVGAAAAFWGTWALFLRPAGLPGLQNAAIVLAVFSAAIPFCLRRASFADRGAVIALGIVGLADAGNIALYFDALGQGPVSVAVLTHYLAPLLVALAAPWVGEVRSPRAMLAAPLSLVGLGLLLGTPGGGLPWRTALEGAGSAVFYAAIVFGAKRAGRSFSPLAVSAVHGPVSLAVLLVLFGRAAIPLHAPLHSIAPVAAGGVFCGLFASGLFYAGLRRVSAQLAGSLAYLEPVSAVLCGAIAFGEPLTALGLAGGLVVLGAGLYVALERRAPAPVAPELA